MPSRQKYRISAELLKKGTYPPKKLIKDVSQISGIAEADVELVYRVMWNQIKTKLLEGRDFHIVGLGAFKHVFRKEMKARTGWGSQRGKQGDPRFAKGTEIIIPKRIILKFYVERDFQKTIWVAGIKRGDVLTGERRLAADRSVTVRWDKPMWEVKEKPKKQVW